MRVSRERESLKREPERERESQERAHQETNISRESLRGIKREQEKTNQSVVVLVQNALRYVDNRTDVTTVEAVASTRSRVRWRPVSCSSRRDLEHRKRGQ